MSKNGIRKLNYGRSLIILDSRLSAGLRRGNSDAETRLQELRALYPDFTIHLTQHQNKGKCKSSITYETMAKVFTKNGKAELMKEINEMRFAKVIDEKQAKRVPKYSPSQVRQRFYELCREYDIEQTDVEEELNVEMAGTAEEQTDAQAIDGVAC